MTPAELADRVTAHYPDAQRIGDNVVQFIRRAGSRPFAVYYLDCKSDIPRSPDELRSYQDSVIGRRYFDGPSSLQWNNYLYFVANHDRLNASDAARIREMLELDRTYARKFLIGETELGNILEPDVVKPGETTETSVLSIWNNTLAQAGLGRAVWGDLDMPRRLALVEAAAPTSRSSLTPTPLASVGPGQRLARLSLVQYRDYPLEREFDFGTVNLIFGPNASGKTSLMEAIELFYCGRNKRSPDSKPVYDLRATLGDGTTERATNTRALKVFRQRNLSWYGQPEVLKSNLYSSFARFNFLDTDAAVRLADEASTIDEDLSKLLVGPDAAKTWENMSKVNEQTRSRLRDLREEERKLQAQVAEIDSLLATLTAGSGSDLVRHRLLNMLRQRGWRPPTVENPDDLPVQLIGPLSEFVALARQAADLPLSPVPSRNALTRFIRATTTSRNKAIADIEALSALEQKINIASTTLKRAREAADVLERANSLVAAGLPVRIAERERLRQAAALISNQLAGIDLAIIVAAAAAHPTVTADAYFTRARTASAKALTTLGSLRTQHARLRATRERSANLAEELRDIARQYLNEIGDPSECPLCHTHFEPGELIGHLDRRLSEQIDRSDQELAARVRGAEEALRIATAEEAGAATILAFAHRAEISVEATLAEIADAASQATDNVSKLLQQLRVVESELKALENQGLRWVDLDRMRLELVRRRFPPADWSDAAMAATAAIIANTISEQDVMLAECGRDVDKLKQQLADVLGISVADAREARVGLANLEQKNAAAENLANKLAALDGQFRIPATKPLGELAVDAEAVRQVAVELQIALQQEKENNLLRTQSAARRRQIQQELEKIAPRIKSLAAAATVLQRLQRDHSLHAAMEQAIQQNRSAIESIFGQIHAPHEFLGLGDQITTLRRLDGTVSSLAEISTGQRAALGLSMFLAQNMKLRDAPPVILIDDPIAYVDDLNCLSFLDYLREIALTKRRQIFFSTANDKLAAMFERKFDFLGTPDFRKIELHRESSPSVSTIH